MKDGNKRYIVTRRSYGMEDGGSLYGPFQHKSQVKALIKRHTDDGFFTRNDFDVWLAEKVKL